MFLGARCVPSWQGEFSAKERGLYGSVRSGTRTLTSVEGKDEVESALLNE